MYNVPGGGSDPAPVFYMQDGMRACRFAALYRRGDQNPAPTVHTSARYKAILCASSVAGQKIFVCFAQKNDCLSANFANFTI